jgi:hypothetical protein
MEGIDTLSFHKVS